MRTSHKELWMNITLLLMGLLIGLLLMEGMLRLLFPFRPGEANSWEQYVGWAGHPYQIRRPNSVYVNVREIAYNSRGLRDQEYSYDKPEDVYRILILGDSFVESEQAHLPDTFHKQLETLLNVNRPNPDQRIEVIAASHWGWGTDQAVLFFEQEGYKYQPDLTILLFVFNDVCNNYAPCESQLQGQRDGTVLKPYFTLEDDTLTLHNFPFSQPQWMYGDTWHAWLYRKLRVYQLARNGLVWANVITEEAPPTRLNAETEPHPGVYIYAEEYPEMYEQGWQLTKRLIQRLRDSAREHGSQFVVIAASSDFATYPDTAWARYTEFYPQLKQGRWNWHKPDEILQPFLQEQGIPFFAMQPEISARAAESDDLLHIPIDQHWSETGHTVAAEVIYQYLTKSGLLDHADEGDAPPP